MTESTLALHRIDYQKSVGLLAGFGIDSTAWNPDQRAKIEHCVSRGFARTYSPPVLPGELNSHTWSFMQPVLLPITIHGQYTTGTVTIAPAGGGSTVTGDGTTFPTWAASGNIVIDRRAYSVKTRTSGTALVLDDDNVTAAAGTLYALSQADYEMPDDFGAFVGDLYYTSNNGRSYRAVIRRTPMAQILDWRTWRTGATQPYWYAVQPKASDGTAFQKWWLSLAPDPVADATILGEYIINPDALATGATFALGGYPFSEVLREGCLAACETEIFGEIGLHTGLWMQQLQAAISFDRRASNPSNLGRNLNPTCIWPNRGPHSGWPFDQRSWNRFYGSETVSYV